MLYVGSVNQRGFRTRGELLTAAAAAGYPAPVPEPAASLNRLFYGLFNQAPWSLRLTPMLSTLLTGAALALLTHRAMPRAAGTVTAVYFSTALVFLIGTSALPLAPAVLALTLTVCGAAGLLLRQSEPFRLLFLVVMLAGSALLLRSAPLFSVMPTGRNMLPATLLGLLPWLLLLPVILSGLRHAAWRNPLLWGACAGAAGSLALSLSASGSAAALPGAAPFLSILAGCGVDAHFEGEPDGGRFNRLLRTYCVVAGTGAFVLLALLLMHTFGHLPPRLVVYRNRGTWLAAAAALVMLVCWWQFAMRETSPRVKIDSFAIGAAMALFCSQMLIPSGWRMTMDHETPLRLHVKPLLRPDTMLVSDPYWAPAAWLLCGGRDFRILRRDGSRAAARACGITPSELAEKIAAGARHVVLIRRSEAPAPELPRARRRMFFRPVNLSVMEF